MIRLKPMICLALLAALATSLSAGERAATGKLPPAMKSLGIAADQIVSTDEAARVRGAGGGMPPVRFDWPPACPPVPYQVKQYCLEGVAAGTVTVMEGMIAQFQYINSEGLAIQGTFGGLEGSIGVVDGNLAFALQGKAYQETLEFAGHFVQQFYQVYGMAH